MVKRNTNKKDEYWWWNKRTDEISNKKPETFDRELTTFKSNISNDKENNDFTQKIIKDYGEWKFMRTKYSKNEIKEWWWNPTTEECQFHSPKCVIIT